MQKMKRTEFAALMTRLRACYQNTVADKDLWLASMATYWERCRHYDADAIRQAIAVADRHHKQWMPSRGQLVELIEGFGGAIATRCANAWPELMRLASRSSGEHSDPIAAEAIRLMGGGKRLGQMATEDLEVWGRKQFEEMYERTAAAHARGAEHVKYGQLPPGAKDIVKSLAGKMGMP